MNWKTLAKIGLVGAAPFTGGASLAAMPLVDAIGHGASAAAGSMAQNRGTQAALTLDSNKQFEDELMKRMAFNQQSRNNDLRNSTFSSMLANYQPAARPNGIAPSSLTTQGQPGQEALTLSAQQALQRLQAGNAMPLPANIDMADMRTVPDKFGKSSAWEKILGILGAGASAYGGISAGRGGSGNGGGNV